jgi:asparagine synthase (glutamine-hydrolysing)
VDSRGQVEPFLFASLQDMFDKQPADNRQHYDLGLGHRRLSIIDLNTGDQPMCNEDGSIWIVFNGEIYNYRELRQALQARGHVFRTVSDTEVILHAYEEYGQECPAHFNGIFAFGIWDAKQRGLFLVRDHFGVKPLYFRWQAECFSFASEIKALLCDERVPRELNVDALNLCLTFRHTPSPWTLFQGIQKLPPGCSAWVNTQGINQKQYWDDKPVIDRACSPDEWLEQLRDALEAAVVRQMVSDVPIGISLSSGVDSSVLLALMSEHMGGAVQAFTVGFAGREATSEIEPARQMARRFGAAFYEQVISAEDYASFMQRYMWHLEEPIGNESAAAYYFVAEMARRQRVKVLLNGQGADEAFAGYERYLYAAYGSWLRLGTIPPLVWLLPRLLAGRPLGERYQRLLMTLDAKDETERFLRVYSIMPEAAKGRLLNPELAAQIDRELPYRYLRGQLERAPHGTAVERMTYVDARTSLPDDLLLCEDKMAMAASVEARVPLLDLEWMALAERVPGNLKLRGRRDKYIHRKVCERWVGQEVVSRPKIGFDNAVDLWMRQQLGQEMLQIIKAPGSFTGTYLNPVTVKALMQEHISGQRDHQRVLFLLLSLESWHSVFFKKAEIQS